MIIVEKFRRSVILLLLCAAPVFAQTGTLRGVATDESGGIVARATITLTGSSGAVKQATSGKDGSYEFTKLPFGAYTVQASAPNLILPEAVTIDFKAPVQVLNLKLKIASTHQQVNVNEDTRPAVSTESAGNASAMVLRGADLEALADDPEDLATDLQALAGPSAGPSGGSMYIDGFTGG